MGLVKPLSKYILEKLHKIFRKNDNKTLNSAREAVQQAAQDIGGISETSQGNKSIAPTGNSRPQEASTERGQ